MITPTAKRNLYFYEVEFSLFKNFEGVEHAYLGCFRHLKSLITAKDKSRFLTRDNYTLFMGHLDFMPEKSYLIGKFFKVRNDIFPQIIDLESEDIKDIVSVDSQGILETTHFLIDYRKRQTAQIAIEYNHYGARISELAYYLSYFGQNRRIFRKINIVPITRDRLESFTSRVNRIANFNIRVHKDNIERIMNLDEGLGTALYHAQHYSLSDSVEINLKVDYKIKDDTKSLRDKLFNWVGIFKRSPEEVENFEIFKVEAEDEESNNKLEKFDFLFDKETSSITVEKQEHTRVIISSEFFPRIIKEYERKFS